MVLTGKQDNSLIEWSFDDCDGSLTLSGRGPMGDVVLVESTMDSSGKSTKQSVRDSPWDSFLSEVKTIYFGPEITTVAPAAFFGAEKLVEVHMPGVLVVGNGAFYLCKNLEIVQMPSVLAIGSSSFERCERLSKLLVWQEGEKRQGFKRMSKFSLRRVMSVGNYAFANAKSIEDVSLGQCVSVGKFAFLGCSSLRNASMPNVSQLGQGAFYQCPNLAKTKLLVECTIGKDAFGETRVDEIEYVFKEDEE